MPDFSEFEARGLAPAESILATITVNADATDVWAAISEVGNLTSVHPFCETNEVECWPGPDGRDHVRYYSGIHYRRDVVEWRDGVGYDLAVGPPAGKIAFARWTIEPTGPSQSIFGIEVTSFVRSDVDVEAKARYEKEMINESIPPYLDGVVKGVAHYAETGRPVARNQFGAHPIYSPDVG